MRVQRLFVLCVVVPTTAAAAYFGLIASDVYVSESRFVVRAPERQAPTSLAGLVLKGAGFAQSSEDSYVLHDFVLSRDALYALNEAVKFASRYQDPSIDRLSRFAGLDGDTSFESLFRYYEKQVDVRTDSSSSISTLTVRAFKPEDAWKINLTLLDMGEALVNRLNERGRQDLIRSAQTEVAAAEQRAKDTAVALSAFRSRRSVVDPERQATIQLQQIAKLQDEQIAVRTQLVQLESLARDNPQIPLLKKRVAVLQEAIDAESTRITGEGARSLTNKAADYQRLLLDNEFANKQLAAAMAALEQARNEAQRKQLYLERIVLPGHPDVATEPKRLKAFVVTAVVSLVVWGVLSLLIAGVREHHD